jgi:hypothetical protein
MSSQPEANPADLAEQAEPPDPDEQIPDTVESDPADALEQSRSLDGDEEDFPHDSERDV